MIDLRTGDCLEVMRRMDANSVTAIVTDPPYALEFMGKGWDKVLPSWHIWLEALRVLKPGGMLLSFGGTRTFHRLTCAIEDSGFAIRDCIMWVYGSGFPKSHNISKGIDKAAGAEREVLGVRPNHRPNAAQNQPDADSKAWQDRSDGNITAPATDDAKAWDGYGTALKPAWEPIIVAMKPLDGTFAANALEHGVAGINVDGCRVKTGGRWPANLIHDGSGEVLEQFPATAPSSKGKPRTGASGKGWGMRATGAEYSDAGTAARFFYCAKAGKKDRGKGNTHPTVKPLALMQYLVRLVTMPTGTVILDPFMGSGSTGIACIREGVDFIGIDQDADYVEIARKRCKVEK